MAAAVSTIIFLPLSASPGSDRTAASIGVAHRSAQGTPDHANRFAGRETLGRRTAMRTLGVAPESGGEANSSSSERERVVTGAPSHTSLQGASQSRSERCKPARTAAIFFRLRTHTWQELRDGRLASKSPIVAGKSCRWAKFAATTWEARARSARRSFYRWLNDRTLRDFAFAPGADAWPKAVREVQRVFPGTEGWLLSCSAAESNHVTWVVHGGRSYYPGAENDYNGSLPQVGGPMQYMYGTFTGQFRRGIEYARDRGFLLPTHLRRPSVTAWRSALGQALAGGWARWSGNDNSHWSASWGNGC